MKKIVSFVIMLLLLGVVVQGQGQTILAKGVIADDKGNPIPFATIAEAGTKNATTGDALGSFSIKVKSGAKLIVSAIGYNETTIVASETIKLILQNSGTTTLNEVVVTAGGLTAKRAQLGTASTIIKAQELTQAKQINIASALTGKAAGLQLNTISSGVNPTYRLVLRGNRSLLGNNQALVVVDNVIVPSSILGNLNPEDIEDLQVLNGGGAAALYGSEASNGALIITTKKGKKGQASVYKIGHTVNSENVSFYPGLQNRFGSGADADVQIYTPHENQQYGPAFDGTLRDIGDKLENGTIQKVLYSPNNSKKEFWETGITNITDLSMSNGDDRSTFYMSAQYLNVKGTTLHDKYNRVSMRINGTRDMGKGVSANFSSNYVQNRYDITTVTGSVYDQLLQTPSQIPLTNYKDWKNDPFANPNGYYNAYYANPYFSIDNNRQNVRNDYLTGNFDLKYKPTRWLSFLGRVNITTQNASNKNWTNKFVLTPYTKSLGLSTLKNNDIAGSVSDGESYNTQLMSEFQTNINTTISKDIKFDLTLGTSIRNNTAKNIGVNAVGLTFSGLYNIAARTAANITGSESNTTVRQQGVYGDLRLGYKDYLFLHATGRNDWFSTLSLANRSLFYPSVDASFVVTNAIAALKNSRIINTLKLRAAYTTVGNVNLNAYSLLTTFGQASGYPYNNNPGYAIGSTVYNPNLKPEKTKGGEFGIEAELFNSRVSLTTTVYHTSTTDQIVPVSVSSASGFSTYLTNTGDVTNFGWENTLNVTLYRSKNWEIAAGGNYTYYDNKVKSISDDVTRLNLSSGGNIQVVAEAGQQYPTLRGTDFKRDDLGRIIVDSRTGYPSATETGVIIGNSSPKHILGVNLSAKFKSFRLAIVGEYRGGYVAYADAYSFDFSGSGLRTVAYNRERFVIPNSSYLDAGTGKYVANTSITVRDGGAGFWPSSSYNGGISTNYVFNGAYWKLREVSLSYDFPKEFINKFKFIKGITMALQGRNLLLFTPKENIYTDPDYVLGNNAIGISTLSQTPPTRFFGGSISITL